MSRECTFRDPRLKPDLFKIIADRIDSHSSTVVIDTAENQINLSIVKPSIFDPLLQMLISLIGSDVHVVSFDHNLRVYQLQSLFGGLRFGQSHLHGCEEQSVHIGKFDLVVIVEDKFSNTTPCQHFSGHWTDTTHSDDEDSFGFDIGVVLDDTHFL